MTARRTAKTGARAIIALPGQTTRLIRILVIAALFWTGMLPSGLPRLEAPRPASAQQLEDTTEQPVLLIADELIYDENLSLVTARGSVEMQQGGRVLLADTVTYNEKTDTATASGNVSILEPTGEVLFTDYAELNNALKTGFIENLRYLMADGSRMAANRARRTAGERKVMDRAVFSPCNLCKEDPTRAPLWQVKAVRVIHDERAKDVIYHDATIEFLGIPVGYTPYLRHPDPTVERRSGLLAPRIGYSGELGAIYGQPYHHVFNASRDITIEPTIFTNEGGVLQGEYRQRFERGEINLKGSVAYVDEHDDAGIETGEQSIEGHADLEGQFALNDTWRSGFDFEQASERTYLRRFGLEGKDILTTRLYTEGFRGRNYAALNAYKFQDLRASTDPNATPTVLPFLEYDHVSEPGFAGGQTYAAASLLSLSRDSGTDSRRASLVTGWKLPYTDDLGMIYTLDARVQTDAYLVTDTGTGDDTETIGRVVPQLGMKWQYPWARRSGTTTQVIEPIVGLVLGPNGGNPDEIPNEDSASFEFGTDNLFRMNRFDGVDRVTSGSRVDYGMRAGVYGDSGGSSEVLFGQSYRFYGNSAFGAGTGLREQMSDYVGSIRVSPSPSFDMTYRFRLDDDDYSFRRNEIGFGIYRPQFSFVANYVSLAGTETSGLAGNSEQLETSANLRLSDNWSVAGGLIQDLSDGGNALLRGRFGVNYQDECLIFGLNFERSRIEDEDIEPDDRIMFRLVLKHLGGVESQ
jgi:LPS-assembly protein